MTCASSEDSDQPGRPPSLIRVFVVHLKKVLVLNYPEVHNKDSDQTVQIPRLIWVCRAHMSFCWFCRSFAHILHAVHAGLWSDLKWHFRIELEAQQRLQNDVCLGKTKIIPRIYAVWSKSLLGTQWVAKDPKLLYLTSKTLIRLFKYAGWSESLPG